MALARPRPAAVTVIAILNIIFGSLGLITSLCIGMCAFFLISIITGDQSQFPPETRWSFDMFRFLAESMNRHVPGFGAYLAAMLLFSLVLSLMLLISGIGLLRMQPWARATAIAYAVISIIETLAGLGYMLAVVNPNQVQVNQEFLQWLKDHPPPAQPGKAQQPMGPIPAGGQSNPLVDAMSSLVSTTCALIYPIIVLIFMLLPGVAAAFKGRPPDELSPGAMGPPGSPGPVDDFYGYDRPYGKQDF